jgi:hypothetical protein
MMEALGRAIINHGGKRRLGLLDKNSDFGASNHSSAHGVGVTGVPP